MAAAAPPRAGEASRPAPSDSAERAEVELELELAGPAILARGMQEQHGTMTWHYAAQVAQESRPRNPTPVSRPEEFTHSRIQVARVCTGGAQANPETEVPQFPDLLYELPPVTPTRNSVNRG